MNATALTISTGNPFYLEYVRSSLDLNNAQAKALCDAAVAAGVFVRTVKVFNPEDIGIIASYSREADIPAEFASLSKIECFTIAAKLPEPPKPAPEAMTCPRCKEGQLSLRCDAYEHIPVISVKSDGDKVWPGAELTLDGTNAWTNSFDDECITCDSCDAEYSRMGLLEAVTEADDDEDEEAPLVPIEPQLHTQKLYEVRRFIDLDLPFNAYLIAEAIARLAFIANPGLREA